MKAETVQRVTDMLASITQATRSDRLRVAFQCKGKQLEEFKTVMLNSEPLPFSISVDCDGSFETTQQSLIEALEKVRARLSELVELVKKS